MQSIPILFGAGFVMVGLRHFQDPAWFEPIVPRILGVPRLWVYFSGLLEIILGLGIMTPKFRPEASILTAMMLVVLYWANLNMWVNDIPIGGSRLSTNGHIIRGLIQALMIWLALWIGDWLPSKS
ncbi:MAG: DoxX family protein [Candidatus Thalassarchaeaceae archaeon]